MKKIYILITVLCLFVNFAGLKASEVSLNKQLLSAALSGSRDAVELLLKKGADVNAVDRWSGTALMDAARSGSKEVVELLLEKGADMNAARNNGKTALMFAAESESQEIVALLLEKGADVNAADVRGVTALMHAANSGFKEVVELFLKKGADVHAVNDRGETALMYAANSGFKEVVELLLEKGADVNAVDKNGWTALMYAAKSGSKEAVELLLEKGADVNAADNNGWTALMYAAFSRSKEVVELLLENGADVNAVNNGGREVIDYAFNPEVSQLLMRYKAFKFAGVDQEFDNEPRPEDYIADKKILAGATGDAVIGMLEQYDEEYGRQIDAFTKDHAAYWHNKVQKVYKPFVFQNDLAPLRTLVTQEIYARSGLIPEIMSFFNSRADFLYVLNELKPGASAQELERLQKIITIEERIEKDIAARN